MSSPFPVDPGPKTDSTTLELRDPPPPPPPTSSPPRLHPTDHDDDHNDDDIDIDDPAARVFAMARATGARDDGNLSLPDTLSGALLGSPSASSASSSIPITALPPPPPPLAPSLAPPQLGVRTDTSLDETESEGRETTGTIPEESCRRRPLPSLLSSLSPTPGDGSAFVSSHLPLSVSVHVPEPELVPDSVLVPTCVSGSGACWASKNEGISIGNDGIVMEYDREFEKKSMGKTKIKVLDERGGKEKGGLDVSGGMEERRGNARKVGGGRRGGGATLDYVSAVWKDQEELEENPINDELQLVEKTTNGMALKPSEERRVSGKNTNAARALKPAVGTVGVRNESLLSMQHQVDYRVIRRYYLMLKLGQGAYGEVWKAVDRETREFVAVKKIFGAFANELDAQRTFREVFLLRFFNGHPNFVRFVNLIPSDTKDDIYLVFEYMETDLHCAIRAKGLLTDLHIEYITFQLIRSLLYMHSAQIVHRDIKPSNILLDMQCTIRMADLGLARCIAPDFEDIDLECPMTQYVATRWYRAPEVLLCSKNYSFPADMWAVGCILAELYIQRPLFPGENTLDQLKMIFDFLGFPSEEDIDGINSKHCDKILYQLQKDPQPTRSRLPYKDILLKYIPPEARDLIFRLLQLDPRRRPTAQEALEHNFLANFFSEKEDYLCHESIVFPLKETRRYTAEQYREVIKDMIESRRSVHRSFGRENARYHRDLKEVARHCRALAASLSPHEFPASLLNRGGSSSSPSESSSHVQGGDVQKSE